MGRSVCFSWVCGGGRSPSGFERSAIGPAGAGEEGGDMRQANRERIIGAVRRFAGRTQGPILAKPFAVWSHISLRTIYGCFPRGWHSVLEAAGLIGRARARLPLTDECLLYEFDRVARKFGRTPTWSQFVRRCTRSIPARVVSDRFGGPAGVLARYGAWKEREERTRSEGGSGETSSRSSGPRGTAGGVRRHGAGGRTENAAREVRGKGVARRRHGRGMRRRAQASRRVLGEPVPPRGFAHAPVTETGVVHAAGVLWREAGLIVTRLGVRFPDGEALRRVPGGEGWWERVRVEFELRSSDFLHHGHDPKGCDLVVCWEHDWAECPVEVLELRALVAGAREERGAGVGA